MIKPTVYRPPRDEHNPIAHHYGALPVEYVLRDYLSGIDYPVSGDIIAVRSVRVTNLPPVGNKTLVYCRSKINGVYSLRPGWAE